MSSIAQVQTRQAITTGGSFSSHSVSLKAEHEDLEPTAVPSDKIPLPPSSEDLTQVLGVDRNTPDGHVARDPRLLRLTGSHPFNCEPPLTELYKQGKA